jgi:hypothetical protein
VKHRLSLVLPILSSLFLAAGCGEGSPGAETSALRFDPCHPLVLVLDPGTTADRQAGVQTAADLWNGIAGARLSVTAAAPPLDAVAVAAPAALSGAASDGAAPDGAPPDGAAPGDASRGAPPTVPLRFEAAAALSHGFYDPVRGLVLVNDDLVARPLAVTIAHEVGHAFGLVHVTNRPSVMNPGNLEVEPNASDATALADLWGRCDPAPSD